MKKKIRKPEDLQEMKERITNFLIGTEKRIIEIRSGVNPRIGDRYELDMCIADVRRSKAALKDIERWINEKENQEA